MPRRRRLGGADKEVVWALPTRPSDTGGDTWRVTLGPGDCLRYRAVLELCEEAVAAALGAGASYADARVIVRRSQVVGTRNRRVERPDASETQGIGVRVL